MNKYKELNDRIQKEVNELPLGFAFSNEQFEQMMNKWGLTVNDTDKIYRIGGGGFIQKSDYSRMTETFDRHKQWLKDAVAADPDGTGFIFDMFSYELRNHEYAYTGDAEDTLDALGFTYEDLENDARLAHGFRLACEKIGGEDI
jgi:hypothetical protein